MMKDVDTTAKQRLLQERERAVWVVNFRGFDEVKHYNQFAHGFFLFSAAFFFFFGSMIELQ